MGLSPMVPAPAAPPPPRWPPPVAVGLGRPSREFARAMLGVTMGGLTFKSVAANKFTMGVEEAIHEITPSMATVATVVLSIVGCGGAIWGWCAYLERRPTYEQMRNKMLALLAAVTVFELSLCLLSDVHWWMTPLLLVTNTWGLLDAVIRFPVAYDLDTFFSLKQIALLISKMFVYTFGFVDVHENKVVVFVSLLVNIIAMPLVYFLALPLEEEEAAAPAGRVVDVDIAVRLMRIAFDTQERQEFLLVCRRRSRSMLAWLGRASPCAGEVLLHADPSMRRVLWKNVDI